MSRERDEGRGMNVCLNVGGCVFHTSRGTLTGTDTFFSGLVAHASEDLLFIDRDPTHFRHVLNWLRGVRYLPDDDGILTELMFEADFYCMPDMVSSIRAGWGNTRPCWGPFITSCGVSNFLDRTVQSRMLHQHVYTALHRLWWDVVVLGTVPGCMSTMGTCFW